MEDVSLVQFGVPPREVTVAETVTETVTENENGTETEAEMDR